MAYAGDPRNEKDYRPGAITRIGCIGVPMLIVSAGLAAFAVGAVGALALVLPLIIILAMVIGIVAVWYVPAKKTDTRQLEILQKRLSDLDQRLANLETIDAFERRLTLRDVQAMAAGPAGETPAGTEPIQRQREAE